MGKKELVNSGVLRLMARCVALAVLGGGGGVQAAPLHEKALSLDEALKIGLNSGHAIHAAKIQRIVDLQAEILHERSYQPVLGGSLSVARPQERTPPGASSEVAALLDMRLRSGGQIELSSAHSRSTANGLYGAEPLLQHKLSLRQPLLKGGPRSERLKTEESQSAGRIARLTFQASIESFVMQVASAYADAALAQARARVSENVLGRATEAREMTDRLILAGRNAPSELLAVDGDVAVAEIALTQAQLAQSEALRRLLLLIGANDQEVSRLDDPPALPALPSVSARNLALKQRTEYLIGAELVQLAELGKARASLESLPQLDVIVAVQSGSSIPMPGGSAGGRSQSIELQTRWTFGDKSVDNAKSIAHLALERALLERSSLESRIVAEVDDAIVRRDTVLRQYSLSQKSLELSKRRLATEFELLRIGRSNQPRLSAALEATGQAELASSEARVSLFSSALLFAASVGQLSQLFRIDTLPEGGKNNFWKDADALERSCGNLNDGMDRCAAAVRLQQ